MATLNDLPSSITNLIQAGFLEREFHDALTAKLGFRVIADKEPFMAGIGETVTKTRIGLLPENTTPMAPASVSDITSGLTNTQWAAEQYVLGVAQYAAPMQLNVATATVAIDDLFLANASRLAENAARSIDRLAQRALFDQYLGGNTRVTVTLGTAGTTVKVDDVRGFFMTQNSQGTPVPVSSSFPLGVMVGNDLYTISGVTADGTAPSQLNPWMANLSFSGTSTNTSTTPGGYSGTLTFTSNVTTADATAGNTVTSSVAPLVQRPYITSSGVMVGNTSQISSSADDNQGRLTMRMMLNAKAQLEANAVPGVGGTDIYHAYFDPIHLTGLYQDSEFQSFFRGREDSEEYRRGVIFDQLGIKIMRTNMNPVQTDGGFGTVRRGVICGQGALVEAEFTNTAYQQVLKDTQEIGLITVIDGIAHITRPPLDTLQQVITQAWGYIGGFVAPTDTTTTPTTIPTASNAAYKRAVILESL